MGLPVIYVAYHNKKDGYLSSQPEEIEGIENLLVDYSHVLNCRVQLGNSSAQTIFNHLGKFSNDLVIFHYSGHATGQYLDLDEHFTFGQLANVFAKRCPKLVFLNGCKTKGFVEKLLIEGVEAVIATSVNVKDKDAARFALNFYREFAQRGTGLVTAFRQASSVFTDDTYIGGMETDDELSLYNLFYTVDPTSPDKKPDWELVSLNRAQAAIEDELIRNIYLSIENSKKKIDNIKTNLAKYDSLFSGQLSVAQLTYREKEFTEPLTRLEDQIEEKEDELEEAERQQGRTERSTFFLHSLLKFNYIDQIPLVQTYFDEVENKPCVGAFIIQGGSRCGIELLQERIIGILNIEKFLRHPRPVIIDSQSLAISSSSLWAIIKDQLKLSSKLPDDDQIDNPDLKAIVGELHLKYLKNVHLLIEYRIDYTQVSMVSDLILRIHQFWDSLTKNLPSAYLGDPKSKKLLLFVVDKVDYQPILLQGLKSREEAFSTAFMPYIPKILPLPIISTVSQDTIKKWRRVQEVPDKLMYEEFEPEDRNYVLTAIKKICEQTYFHKVFQDHFRKYEPLPLLQETILPYHSQP